MRGLVNDVSSPPAIQALRPMVNEIIERYLWQVNLDRLDVIQHFSCSSRLK